MLSRSRNPLVPELLVSDLTKSLAFWTELIGFAVRFARTEEGFVYLDRDGAQLMLEQHDAARRVWLTDDLAPPFGRGINFQIEVRDVVPIVLRLAVVGWPLYLPVEDAWYRADTLEIGQRQFLVQDPDGYLLRLAQPLGERPVMVAMGSRG